MISQDDDELPPLTPLQQKQLAHYLCDPFLTFDEALRLVGVRKEVVEVEKRIAA